MSDSDNDFSNVVIRACREEDISDVLTLWREAGATASVTDTPEKVRAAIKVLSCFLVAEESGRIIGSIMGGFDGWRANIYRLAVLPEHRRRGIARKLVGEVEVRLKAMGVQRISALVEHDHPWAIAFWKAMGYGHDVRIGRFVRNVRTIAVCCL